MKKSVFFPIITTLASASIVFAQNDPGVVGIPFELDRSQIQHLYMNEFGELTNPSYDDRALAVVHDGLNGTGTPQCAVYLNQAATPQPLVNILEDLSFSPGPWASTTNNLVQRFTISISNSAPSGTINFDLRMRFWNPSDVDFTRNPMIAASAMPLSDLTVPIRNLGPGLFTITFTLAAADQFTIPGNSVFFQGEALDPGTMTYFSGTQIPFWGVSPGGFVPQAGSSSPDQGFDRNRNGVFEGSPTPGNTLEHSALVFPAGSPCAGLPVHYPMVIEGDVPATPPATFMDLGSLTDSSTMTFTIPANDVKWFRFTLSTDVSDATAHFLDIDTEGSSIGNTDMALFDDSGNVISTNAASGSGDLAHLSFGIGRRPADPAGGKSFDGNDGELTAGTYWLAITSGGTAFSGGFVATNTGTGGTATIHIRSNIISNILGPSTPPAGDDLVADLGNIIAPGVATTATTPDPFNVLWYKFTVCQDVTASGSNYFDIDFSNNDQLGDTIAFLFDSTGMLLTSNDDGNPPDYLSPQFSFGPTGNPRPSPNPDALPFEGQDGTLPRGTYYLGVAFFPATTLPTNDRWHIRAGGGSSLSIEPDFYTNIANCTPQCIADVDDGTGTGTPDGGVTIDDLLYYLVIYGDGTAAADVDDGTGTGTPDGGVTIDDLLYYLSRYAAGC